MKSQKIILLIFLENGHKDFWFSKSGVDLCSWQATRIKPPLKLPFENKAIWAIDTRLGDGMWTPLATAPLPEHIHRTNYGPVSIIRWVSDCSNHNEYRNQTALADLWLAQIIQREPDPQFNEYGDKPWIQMKQPPHKEFAWYHSRKQLGIIAIIDKMEQIKPVMIKNYKKWLLEGKTSKGTLIKSLGFVTNTRDHALYIHHEINDLSDGPILWSENNQWWQINPDGNWISKNPQEYTALMEQLKTLDL